MLYRIEKDWLESYLQKYPVREKQVRYALGLLAKSQGLKIPGQIIWEVVDFKKFNNFLYNYRNGKNKPLSAKSIKTIKNYIFHLMNWLRITYGVNLDYSNKNMNNNHPMPKDIKNVLKKTKSPLIKIFCSYIHKKGIPLIDITEGIVRKFLEDSGKRGSYRHFARNWNNLYSKNCVPQKLPVPEFKKWSLKMDELPESLRDEIYKFEQWSISDDYEVEGAHKRKEIRPVTFKWKRGGLLQYLYFLKAVKNIDLSKYSLKNLLQVDKCLALMNKNVLNRTDGFQEEFKWNWIEEFVNFTRERTKMKAEKKGKETEQAGIRFCFAFLQRLFIVLLRDFYGVPEQMLVSLKEKAKRFKNKYNEYQLKEEYIPILDSTTYEDLKGFENALWELYQKEKNRKKKAVIGLVAFIVSLLMRRPFRSRTLRTIKIGRNLLTQKTEDGERRIFRLFPKENLKCGKEIVEMSVPKILEPKLDIFLKEIRPVLMDEKTGDYLLPGLGGGVLSKDSLYNLLVYWSMKLLGKPLNPHLWRHLYATIRLRKDPSKLYAVSKMLMHASVKMTEKIYSRYCQKDAGDDLDKMMGEE